MDEKWIDIEGFEGLYAFNKKGEFKSLEKDDIRTSKNGKQYVRHLKEKPLRPTPDGSGYLQIDLRKNGERYTKKVHKLVAEAFLPNPHGYTEVHHKDKNQLNNHVENLEWIDEHEHDALHGAEKAELYGKTVYQLEDGEIVNIWKSVEEAARVLKLNARHIHECCNGGYPDKSRPSGWHKSETHGGFGWNYSPINTKKRQDDLSLALI